MNHVWLLPCDAMLPGTARRLITESTVALDRGIVETALLLTSEIVTNALQYGQTRSVSLRLTVADGDLRVDVDDNVAAHPVRRTPDPLEERGRGIMLLDALSSQWGVMRTYHGKVVWFRLSTEILR